MGTKPCRLSLKPRWKLPWYHNFHSAGLQIQYHVNNDSIWCQFEQKVCPFGPQWQWLLSVCPMSTEMSNFFVWVGYPTDVLVSRESLPNQLFFYALSLRWENIGQFSRSLWGILFSQCKELHFFLMLLILLEIISSLAPMSHSVF